MKLYVRTVGMIGTNCYIVSDKDKCAVIDPGADAEKLLTFLEEKKLTPEYIILTHGHHDHIGAVKKIKEKYNLKVCIGENDAEMLKDPQKSLAAIRFKNYADYIIEADILLKEGDVLAMGEHNFFVYDTPGHTKGGISIVCEDMIFTGDTLFKGDVGRVDLYGGDFDMLKKSLAKLAKMDEALEVYPGHGERTSIKQEIRTNPYIGKQDYDSIY